MSIWFTKAFIGAVLRKNGRRMGTLSEEFGDGWFSVQKGRVFICREVHAISLDLHLYGSDAKLGPARKLRLTLCLIRLARLPAAADCRPAVIAAWRAMIQYC
jgi:hypothetical protein